MFSVGLYGSNKDLSFAFGSSYTAHMTVLQHLKFYAQIRGLTWEEESTQAHVKAIEGLLGLSKHRDKEATDLSGGYKRRLSLAVAMVGYPKVSGRKGKRRKQETCR